MQYLNVLIAEEYRDGSVYCDYVDDAGYMTQYVIRMTEDGRHAVTTTQINPKGLTFNISTVELIYLDNVINLITGNGKRSLHFF